MDQPKKTVNPDDIEVQLLKTKEQAIAHFMLGINKNQVSIP